MKVLIATPYFYDKNKYDFSKTPSGFGYMVKDIMNFVSKRNDVYVFTHQFTKGYKESYDVLPHRKRDIITTLSIKNIYNGFMDGVKNDVNFSTKLHYLYYEIDKGLFKKTIMDIEPDIIHIHGLTFQTKAFISACIEMNKKFIVTLHGLNGLSESIMLPKIEKEYEYKVLKELEKADIPVTVISSGIKRRIKEQYGLSVKNVKVILNGVEFNNCNAYRNITNKKKNIVCVGSICHRKNQKQLLEAIKEAPKDLQQRIHITFIGIDSDKIDLNSQIKKYGLSDVAEYIGFVQREQMIKYWENADLNIVMSQDEGFGLSMIEGFMYGVPTLTFSDLDAINDIYNQEAFELFLSRNNSDVIDGINKAIKRQFDKEKIMEWGKQFSMDEIGLKYSILYEKVVRG